MKFKPVIMVFDRIDPCKMSIPFVSIVMAAFGAELTIKSCIESIMDQRHIDWELIIIDDGSPVPVQTALKDLSDDRIHLVRFDHNRGLPSALNVGIAQARGRFIARMDADDLMEDERLKEQVSFLLAHGVSICGTGAMKFGSEEGIILNPADGSDIIDTLMMGNPFVHPTVMFDRHELGSNLYYDPHFLCEEDYELWARTVTAGNAANIRKPLLRYRTVASGNAQHPFKKVFKRRAVATFAERFGLERRVPLNEITEFQLTGFVDEPGFLELRSYALDAHREGWPKLGSLHSALVESRSYAEFFRWLTAARELLIH